MDDKKVYSDFYKKLGNNIAFSRKKKGIDQERLGQLSGLSRTSIVNIEKGRQKPSIHRLMLFARILDADVSNWLYEIDLLEPIPKSTIEILEKNHPDFVEDTINFLISQQIQNSV